MVGWSVPGVVHLREVREDPVGRRVVARHRITRKSLAVTYLSDELLADTEFRARFPRELGALKRVRDARVPRVHRYVEGPHGAAVVSDHIDGTSLHTLLRTHGAVSTAAALVVLKDLLRGLAACHAAGVAHGDIKPETVILTRAGDARLVDFGLSTFHGRRQLTRSTPFYLAPEQWSDHPATPAGDVYAATVTFFECLIGAPPFYAGCSAELATKHRLSTPLIDAVPEPARELVLRGIAKDPQHRPEARHLRTVLDAAARQVTGAGWEQHGRREVAALLDSRSIEVIMPNCRNDDVGRERRQPVRLTAVVGGALALAAGLASPPLAAIVPEGGIFGSDVRSPVLAFPEPTHGTSPVRAATNGRLADRTPGAAATAKPQPAVRPLAAPAQPNKERSPASPVPLASPRISLDSQGGQPAGHVHRNQVVQPQPASDPIRTETMPTQPPGSLTLPAPIQLPIQLQWPVLIQLPEPVHGNTQPRRGSPVQATPQVAEGTGTKESADVPEGTADQATSGPETSGRTPADLPRRHQMRQPVGSGAQQQTHPAHNR
ncbi:MAG: protein kinase domain-containing protein [Pseudonocardiaceae bacterium]